jgi:hypothetical protein
MGNTVGGTRGFVRGVASLLTSARRTLFRTNLGLAGTDKLAIIARPESTPAGTTRFTIARAEPYKK